MTGDVRKNNGAAHLWLTDQSDLEGLRLRVRAGDPAVAPDRDALRTRATFLIQSPAPVVTDKTFTAHSPSRDPHDYVSVGTYFWPNPETADGVPYIRRDGRISPDLGLYDRSRWDLAADAMITTARAAYFLGERVFAEEAAGRIRRWFMDPATRMNPHFRYAQMVPGVAEGRPWGIIDFALNLPIVLDHIALLASLEDSVWTPDDQESMARWCGALLDWLESHPLARQEEQAGNNHGTFYDRFVVCLSLFLGQSDRATAQLAKTGPRIAQQIEPDGRMPHELARSCSFGYGLMNLRGFIDLAWIGRCLGVDLWSWSDDQGRRIPAAAEFFYRFACSRAEWPWEQIEPIDWRMLQPVFHKANRLSGGAYPLSALAHRFPQGFNPDAFPMVEPGHPFGQARVTPAGPG
jgi:hypothetical protein